MALAKPDREAAKVSLEQLWQQALLDDSTEIPDEVVKLINSKLMTVRYCLPTQILGKLMDSTLDALCLQAGSKQMGQWDPRSFASAVISPWVLANQKVLGDSADPYVSKPLRRTRLDVGVEATRDPSEWQAVTAFIKKVEDRADPEFTSLTFMQILCAIRDRMRAQDFVFIVPPRVSAAQAKALIRNFMAQPSGGARGLAVAAALFDAIHTRFSVYHEIRRGAINTADAASGAVADLECVEDGHVVLAVEVKERLIGLDDLRTAIAKARTHEVRELLLCTLGISAEDGAAAMELIAAAWASGTNVYVATTIELLDGLLPLLGEGGTRDFLVQIGKQLDRFNTQPIHRKAGQSVLEQI